MYGKIHSHFAVVGLVLAEPILPETLSFLRRIIHPEFFYQLNRTNLWQGVSRLLDICVSIRHHITQLYSLNAQHITPHPLRQHNFRIRKSVKEDKGLIGTQLSQRRNSAAITVRTRLFTMRNTDPGLHYLESYIEKRLHTRLPSGYNSCYQWSQRSRT